MKKLLYIICILAAAQLHAESLISSMWTKLKNNQVDRSKSLPGIERVNAGMFHYYKLKRVTDTPKNDANTSVPQELADVVEHEEKGMLYGSNSPLRDDAVTSAWSRYDTAKARLQKHRDYMRSVHSIRIEKAAAKEMSGRVDINQTDE